MKKKHGIMVLLVFFVALSVQAQQTATGEKKSATISLITFNRLVINTAIEVVLVQDDVLKQAVIEGDAASIAGITLFTAKGTMTVSGKETSGGKKIKLTIPVSHLSWIEVNAGAQVSSYNALSSPKLTVYINGDCMVSLQSAGKIAVTGGGTQEVTYTRNIQKKHIAMPLSGLLK